MVASDSLDIELLKDKPTLFYRRLLIFLSEEDAMGVITEIANICQGCWDADATECDCGS